MQTHRYEVTDEDFANPERGLHAESDLLTSNFNYVRTEGMTLTRVYVRLDDYRNAALDQAFLDSLDSGFARARQAGVKIILRFAYNFSSSEPDAPSFRILQHIGQLTPLMRDNADVIAVLQAGFIGAWGEWHSSTNLLDGPEDRAAVLGALLTAMPESRTVQVRAPLVKQQLFGGPLSEDEAFGSDPSARIGHHNDCFLANDDDAGTYSPGSIERWKDWLAEDSRYVMVGGETCLHDPPRSDCPTALEELGRFNWTYLNGRYAPRVLQSWQEQGCFEEIQRHLGYRLALHEVAHTADVAPGETMELDISLRNSGYAPLVNPRPVYVVLENDRTRRDIRLDDVDPRWWAPGQDSVISTRVPVPADLPPGDYRLALWLPDNAPTLRDRAEYAVRLANVNVWDADAGYNVLVDELQIG